MTFSVPDRMASQRAGRVGRADPQGIITFLRVGRSRITYEPSVPLPLFLLQNWEAAHPEGLSIDQTQQVW